MLRRPMKDLLAERKNGLNQNGGCVMEGRGGCEQNFRHEVDGISPQIGCQDPKSSEKLGNEGTEELGGGRVVPVQSSGGLS